MQSCICLKNRRVYSLTLRNTRYVNISMFNSFVYVLALLQNIMQKRLYQLSILSLRFSLKRKEYRWELKKRHSFFSQTVQTRETLYENQTAKGYRIAIFFLMQQLILCVMPLKSLDKLYSKHRHSTSQSDFSNTIICYV